MLNGKSLSFSKHPGCQDDEDLQHMPTDRYVGGQKSSREAEALLLMMIRD